MTSIILSCALQLPIDTTCCARPASRRRPLRRSGFRGPAACARSPEHERGRELGLVLHVAHLHHGLRGAEADARPGIRESLAARPQSALSTKPASTPRPKHKPNPPQARPPKPSKKRPVACAIAGSGNSCPSGKVDAVATAHTLDDQAETVLAKFLRGAWTEGLSGIHPVLEFPEGRILRPLLADHPRRDRSLSPRTRTSPGAKTPRIAISHSPAIAFATNCCRCSRPGTRACASTSRRWPSWPATKKPGGRPKWLALAPQLILPGRPVRGGGRAAADGLALDVTRLASIALALQRRLLRHAAAATRRRSRFPCHRIPPRPCRSPGAPARNSNSLTVCAPSAPTANCASPHSPQRASPPTVRKLHPSMPSPSPAKWTRQPSAFASASQLSRLAPDRLHLPPNGTALLRSWKPGDRVRVRYSSRPRKVKEVLERMKVTDRAAPLGRSLNWTAASSG